MVGQVRDDDERRAVYVEAAAVVHGPLAHVLSSLLRSASVRGVSLSSALTPYRVDIDDGVHAIHRAAAAWRAGLALERDDAVTVSAPTSESAPWTTDRAAAVLRLSTRRVQELAAAGDLDGTRVGRAWLLDEASVRMYAARRRAS